MKKPQLYFRAWDNHNKKFTSLIGVETNGPHALEPYMGLFGGGLEIVQFTGLLDRNGRMIWEGDILDNKTFVARNLFHNNLGTVDLPLREEWLDMRSNLEEREVIGNIYQNPELLK